MEEVRETFEPSLQLYEAGMQAPDVCWSIHASSCEDWKSRLKNLNKRIVDVSSASKGSSKTSSKVKRCLDLPTTTRSV